MITLVITVDASAPVGTLERIRKGLEVGDVSNPGPLRRGLIDATDRFDEYTRRRFDRLSKGGGEWAPLAPSTIRAKLATGRGIISTRKSRAASPKTGGKFAAILVETGKLRSSLELSGPGHIRQSIPGGVRTGSKDRTIVHHQFGTTRMPARPVYVFPPQQTLTAMAADVAAGVNLLIQQAAAAEAAAASPAAP